MASVTIGCRRSSTGLGARGLANSIKSLTNSPSESIRATMSFMTGTSASPSGRRAMSTCITPLIPASGLRTSCATTAAI